MRKLWELGDCWQNRPCNWSAVDIQRFELIHVSQAQERGISKARVHESQHAQPFHGCDDGSRTVGNCRAREIGNGDLIRDRNEGLEILVAKLASKYGSIQAQVGRASRVVIQYAGELHLQVRDS